MSRALLQQALDALENHAGNYKLTVKEGVVHNAAIVALQAAIARPEPEAAKPLTDEQIDAIMTPLTQNVEYSWRKFARAIEAAHGIRTDDTEGSAP